MTITYLPYQLTCLPYQLTYLSYPHPTPILPPQHADLVPSPGLYHGTAGHVWHPCRAGIADRGRRLGAPARRPSGQYFHPRPPLFW
jgi:hypothetical protein